MLPVTTSLTSSTVVAGWLLAVRLREELLLCHEVWKNPLNPSLPGQGNATQHVRPASYSGHCHKDLKPLHKTTAFIGWAISLDSWKHFFSVYTIATVSAHEYFILRSALFGPFPVRNSGTSIYLRGLVHDAADSQHRGYLGLYRQWNG